MSVTYPKSNVSRSTHFSNYGVRVGGPIGYCIHTTAGTNSLAFLQSDRRFSTGASCADFLIDRFGKQYQLVERGYCAYHVGKGRWGQQDNDNNLISSELIGIELEQKGNELVTWAQVDSLAQLVVDQGNEYGHRWPYFILGHYELAVPIGRRSDPQGFDWGGFMGALYARAKAKNVPGL